MRTIRLRGLVMGALVVFSGCSTAADRDSTNAPDAPAVGTDSISGIRLSKTLDPELRHATAFHRAVDGWTGGHAPYTSRVSEFGEVGFRGHPYVAPKGRPARGARLSRGERTRVESATEIRLNTVSIRRDTVELGQGEMSVREINGEMVVQRGTVREVVANAPTGVEQLWEFDGKPAGAGDLVVAVQPGGAPYKGTDQRGLIFANEDGSGLVYGEATWVDGNNVRTKVQTTWNGQQIEMRVPHALLESSAYPAALDPLSMNANTTSSTYVPDTASIGTTNAVVWENYNGGFPNLRYSLVSDTSGGVTSSNSPVSSATFQAEPAITVSGTNFTVVWRDTRSGVSNIRLARIGAAGGVGGEIAVAASGSNQFTPDVACISASNCLVTWNEPVGGLQTVRGSVVNPSNGAAGAPFTISTAVAGVDQGAASVATNGTNYFVAWEANVQATLASNVKGANVTGAGVASAPFDVSANGGSDEYTAQVAYNGAQYVVGYTSFATDEDALAQLVSPGGGNVGGAIVIGSGAGDQSQPAFAANGSTLLAAYYNQNNISGAPLNGATVGSAFTIAGAATSEDSPKVSFGSGSNYYVVYNDRTTAGPPSTWTAQGTRATTSAAVAPTVDLSVAAQICDSVTVNFNPASPQTVGTAVTVTGNASCAGGATPQYEFWLNNGSGWMVAQAYSASSTFNWNTTAYAGATYQVLVRTRRVGSTAAYDAQVSANYTLTGGTGICNALTASAAPPSPQAVGTMVTVTGAATCTNAATPEYQFWLNNGGGWNVVQNYGASTTFNWNTGSYPGASYSVLVRTRRAGSTASYEGQTSFSYTLTGGSGVCNALTTAAAPPSPQPVGTSVTISGTATCTNSAIPQYQFYTLAPGGFWHLEQDFSTASSFTWATSGLATGTYTLLVRTRASGTNSVYDSQQSRLYTLQ